MAEAGKQLRIRTSTLKRLKKEYESYEKEIAGTSARLMGMEGDEVKKQKEFLAESQAVLSNVKQKLIEAFQGLACFLSQKGDTEGVANTEQKEQAESLILDVETFLEALA